MKKIGIGIIAFVLPLVCFFIHQLFNSQILVHSLCIAFVLGLYVKLLNLLPSSFRRMIALMHTVMMITLMIYEMNLGNILLEIASQLARVKRAINYYQVAPGLFLIGGLAFTMTRHERIQPLCPYPKTRMSILIGMPFLWLGLKYLDRLLVIHYLDYLSTRLSYILYGVLMGFYVWMMERLNEKNRQIVSLVHLVMSALVIVAILFDIIIFDPTLMYQWLIFSVFCFILRIFKVQFISRSQNTDIL